MKARRAARTSTPPSGRYELPYGSVDVTFNPSGARWGNQGLSAFAPADELRITTLLDDDDSEVAGLAAKINREEAYHRMHAEMWRERLADTPQFRAAVEELWPYALGVLPPEQRGALAARVGLEEADAFERGTHTDGLAELWEEMTMVRRSAPAGAQW